MIVTSTSLVRTTAIYGFLPVLPVSGSNSLIGDIYPQPVLLHTMIAFRAFRKIKSHLRVIHPDSTVSFIALGAFASHPF